MEIEVGDVVAHPRHGMAKVRSFTNRTVKGKDVRYIKLEADSLHGGLFIEVPVDSITASDLREAGSSGGLEEILDVLQGEHDLGQPNRAARHRGYVQKVWSGDLCAVAEVLRDITYDRETGRHKSFTNMDRRVRSDALKRLCEELSIAESKPADEVGEIIEEALAAAIAQNTNSK